MKCLTRGLKNLESWKMKECLTESLLCGSGYIRSGPFTPKHSKLIRSNYIRLENMWFLNPDDVIEAAFQFL